MSPNKSCFLLAGSYLNCHMSWRKRQFSVFHPTKGFKCPLGLPAWSIGSGYCFNNVQSLRRSLGMIWETEEMEGQQRAAHLMLQPVAVGWRWHHPPGQNSISPFPGLSNLLWAKIFLDEGHSKAAVLLFQFWIPLGLVGWRNDTGCQCTMQLSPCKCGN